MKKTMVWGLCNSRCHLLVLYTCISHLQSVRAYVFLSPSTLDDFRLIFASLMGLKWSHYHFNLHYSNSSDTEHFSLWFCSCMSFLFCETSIYLFYFIYSFIGALYKLSIWLVSGLYQVHISSASLCFSLYFITNHSLNHSVLNNIIVLIPCNQWGNYSRPLFPSFLPLPLLNFLYPCFCSSIL